MSDFLTRLKDAQTGHSIDIVRVKRRVIERAVINSARRGDTSLSLDSMFHLTTNQEEFHAIDVAARQIVTQTKGMSMVTDTNGFVSRIEWHNVFGLDRK